jgi:hypothetical protein
VIAADYTELTVDDAIEMLETVDQYRAEHGEVGDLPKIDLDLNSVLKKRGKVLRLEIEGRIWLKPIGVTDDPIVAGTDFSAMHEEMHFSKRRPSGIAIGDTIIAYGVGTGMVLAYYTVTSEPWKIPDHEMDEEWKKRWPWYVEAANESPDFGSRWWELGLHINELVSSFLTEAGEDAAITAAGGRTLGALNFGADKIRLTNDFGEYVVGRIRGVSHNPLVR